MNELNNGKNLSCLYFTRFVEQTKKKKKELDSKQNNSINSQKKKKKTHVKMRFRRHMMAEIMIDIYFNYITLHYYYYSTFKAKF